MGKTRQNRWITALIVAAISTMSLVGGGCTRSGAPPSAESVQADNLRNLYMELEQKYHRTMEMDGFSLEYSAEPPNTIVIKLDYVAGSKEESKALDVAAKARDFAKGMAAGKFAISDLDVRSDNRRLTKKSN